MGNTCVCVCTECLWRNGLAPVSNASDLKGRGFEPHSGQKLYGLIFASMRHMKVADNPTLSDESINRGLVCVARIPSCTDSKDPDAHVLDG